MLELDLRDEVDVPRALRADHRDVRPGEVVDREHAAALARDPVEAVGARAAEEEGERRDPEPRGLPGEVAVVALGHQTAARARTRCSMRAITSSIASDVVSISCASSAFSIRTR